MDTPNISLEMAREVLQMQPFSQFLGTTLTRFDTIAELELPLKPEFLQQNGFVHGGVISYLADNTLTFAGGIALSARVLTSEYKINYVKPAQGEKLIARGEVVSAGRSQSVCQCRVFVVEDGEERLCAFAVGTIVSIRQ